MSVRDAAVLERTLRSALESYKFQLRTMTALFRFSGDSGQIPLELWPSWRKGESFLSHMVPSVTEAQKRNLLSDPIFQQEDLLRLPLLTQLDMPQGMCPYINDHSLGLPRRLRRLRGGPSLHLRHPGDALNLRLLLLHRSALKKKSPDPPRGFLG